MGTHGETSRHNWQEQACCTLSTVIIDFLRVSVSLLCTHCIIWSLFIKLGKCILLVVVTVACKSQSILPVCAFVTGLAFVSSHSDRFLSWFILLLTRRYKVWVESKKKKNYIDIYIPKYSILKLILILKLSRVFCLETWGTFKCLDVDSKLSFFLGWGWLPDSTQIICLLLWCH